MAVNPALFKKCGVKIRGQAPIPRDAGQNIYYVCITVKQGPLSQGYARSPVR